jgi:outer membrane murein-binding lipoprotein Lpp
MTLKPSALIMGAILVGAVGLSGCATKNFVRDRMATEDRKVNAQGAQVNGRLDQDDQRLAGLDQTSREALQRAIAAG